MSAHQAHRFNPGGGVPSADRPAPSLPDVSHDLSFLSSSCIQQASDGPEQPLETSPPAEDPIALLRIQLEEQRAEHKSWKASVEERLGKLEREGKAVAAEEVIVMIPPDAREAAVEQPQADADTDPDATVGGAAEPVQKCDLAPSMWDSAIVLGRTDSGMGRVVTLWALLVLLLNTLLQTTIAVIVVLNMGDPKFVAHIIEDLWYASEPRFEHVIPDTAADADSLLGLTAGHPW